MKTCAKSTLSVFYILGCFVILLYISVFFGVKEQEYNQLTYNKIKIVTYYSSNGDIINQYKCREKDLAVGGHCAFTDLTGKKVTISDHFIVTDK